MSSTDPRGKFRDEVPLSGWAPAFGGVCGISESGADNCAAPGEDCGEGLTARTGRAQSKELIDSPASEVGDNMADTLPMNAEIQVNAAGILSAGRERTD